MAMQQGSSNRRTVTWHLGGGPIGNETQLPRSSTSTAAKSTTMPMQQPISFNPSPVKPTYADAWLHLTTELQKMNAERQETQFGF